MKAFGQRKGKIVMGKEFLDGLSAGDIAKIFRHFFVVAIQNEWISLSENTVYYGVSPFFDEIKPGTIIPEYLIEIQAKVHDEIDWEKFDIFKDPVKYEIGSVKFIRREKDEPNEVKREHKRML